MSMILQNDARARRASGISLPDRREQVLQHLRVDRLDDVGIAFDLHPMAGKLEQPPQRLTGIGIVLHDQDVARRRDRRMRRARRACCPLRERRQPHRDGGKATGSRDVSTLSLALWRQGEIEARSPFGSGVGPDAPAVAIDDA